MRSSRDKIRYGLLIDIGSGSVGFAIVASNHSKKYPKIIWKRREHVPVKHIKSITDSNKALISTLTDMALMVAAEGLNALRAHTGSADTTVSEMQVTVAAPWSYTVSRTITFEKEEPFAVTNELVRDLAVAAGEEAMLNFTEKYASVLHDVTETSRCVLDAYANGYRLPVINKQETKTLALTHTTTLVSSLLHAALKELNEKLFGGVPLHVTSSMMSFYYATRQLKPHVYDVCLVDITDEATEIGIVRNGALMYCTHTPFGTLALASEIAKDADRPLSEVSSRLGDILEQKQTKASTAIINSYEEKITELFKETGDALSIPRTIYLLTDKSVLTALLPVITVAASHASKTTSTVLPISQLLSQKQVETKEYALETAARFFHTSHNRGHFEYL